VHTAIQGRTNIEYGRRTLHHSILSERDQVQEFVDSTIRSLEAGTFRPEKYTDPKGSRKFTLLPLISMQAGHIPLDMQTLPLILRRAGHTRRRHLSEEEFTRLVWQNFDFTHLGFQSFEDLFTQDIQWR
jgi:hypothetical protein